MTSELPHPPPRGSRAAGRGNGSRRRVLGSLVSSLAILIGSALVGLAGGVAWAALAPRALYVIVGRGSADVVNPETTAFIAADAVYCLIGAVGGVMIGLTGYLLAVRRYGPAPMAAILAGSVVSRRPGPLGGRAPGPAPVRPPAADGAPGHLPARAARAGWRHGSGLLADFCLAAGRRVLAARRVPGRGRDRVRLRAPEPAWCPRARRGVRRPAAVDVLPGSAAWRVAVRRRADAGQGPDGMSLSRYVYRPVTTSRLTSAYADAAAGARGRGRRGSSRHDARRRGPGARLPGRSP